MKTELTYVKLQAIILAAKNLAIKGERKRILKKWDKKWLRCGGKCVCCDLAADMLRHSLK